MLNHCIKISSYFRRSSIYSIVPGPSAIEFCFLKQNPELVFGVRRTRRHYMQRIDNAPSAIPKLLNGREDDVVQNLLSNLYVLLC